MNSRSVISDAILYQLFQDRKPTLVAVAQVNRDLIDVVSCKASHYRSSENTLGTPSLYQVISIKMPDLAERPIASAYYDITITLSEETYLMTQ